MAAHALKLAAAVPLSPCAVEVLAASAFGPFAVKRFDAASPPHSSPGAHDALLVGVDATGTLPAFAVDAAHDAALLVACADLSPAAVLAWVQLGAQDVLHPTELAHDALPRRVRAAVERKRLEREARTAYAADQATGLPHQQQLIEHMSHLLALREREPTPMAVLAVRIKGLATTEARHGREAAGALRLWLTVRLRAGVRASDVVAAIADDTFAVLLASLLSRDDAPWVGAKLLEALLKPIQVAGSDVAIAAALGVDRYPQDGSQPDALLRRALGLAASAQARLGKPQSSAAEAGGRMPDAANDADLND